MSDFIVKAIVDQLADAGCPLNSQQVVALLDARKKATVKAREEIRNAVRATILAEGLNSGDIKRAAKELTQEVVNNTLKERKLGELIDERIKREISAVFAPASEIKQAIKAAIEREAAKMAHEYIKNNMKVDVSINEAGHYQNGGTF